MRDERTGLEIDYSVNDTISEFGLATFKTTLSRVNETPVESHARASRAWCGGDMALADRLLDAASKKYFMWASPVIMNAPLPGEKIRGLPISCFLSAVTDSVAGLRDHLVEVVDLTTSGGGIGSHWGMIRSADDKSRGVIPHQRIADSMMGGFAQARGRRGSDCAWLPIWHPDAPEFINIRIPTQGDPARKCLGTGYHHGIIIPDSFMHQVEIDGPWDLIDPHTKKVVSTVSARELWRSVLDARMRQGEPFIMFEDAVMKYFPKEQKALGLKSHGSNLCVAPETMLLTREGEFPISSLVNRLVEVWNGKTWSRVRVVQTGVYQKLLTVTLSDGRSLTCTPYHKWYVNDEGYILQRRTHELNPGDELEETSYPTETGEMVTHSATVISVEDHGRYDATYCVNEPLHHKAVFNKILTGNCSEITLPTDEFRTAVCCLSSLNLIRWEY